MKVKTGPIFPYKRGILLDAPEYHPFHNDFSRFPSTMTFQVTETSQWVMKVQATLQATRRGWPKSAGPDVGLTGGPKDQAGGFHPLPKTKQVVPSTSTSIFLGV